MWTAIDQINAAKYFGSLTYIDEKRIGIQLIKEIDKFAKSKNIRVNERKIAPDEMKKFVGCFLTGTAAEITPVSKIDKFDFKVCELIKDLSNSYQNIVRKKSAA